MPSRIAQYQMIPTQTLEEQQRADAAAAWAQRQRAAVAADWAAMHLQDAEDSLRPLLDDNSIQTSQGAPGGLGMPEPPPDSGFGFAPTPAPTEPAFSAAGDDSYLPPPDTTPSPLDVGAERYMGPAVTAPLAPVVPPAPVPEAPWQPPQQVGVEDVGAPAVADLPRTPGAVAGVVGRGLNDRIRQANTEFGESMAANSRALDTGDRADIDRALDLSQGYATALTGEPIASAGAKAVAPVADALGAQAIKKTDEMFADAAGHAATPLRQRLGALGTSLVRATTDAGVDLTNLERDAARTVGRPLNASEMASVQSRLNPFYTARIQVDEALRPVLGDVSDEDYAAVRNALTWKGNVDVAAAKGNPGRAFSGDLSAAESQAALAEQARRLGPRAADVDDRVQAVVDFNKAELERDVAAGLVSREQADQWLQQYPNYTPVVISDYLKEQGRAIGGKSLSVQGTGYKSLTEKGTTRARLDPIAASIDAAYQGEALRRQNTAWRALHDMIQATPEMADLFQVQKGGYTGATKHENSVAGYIDGELYTITTPFPDVAKAIRQEAGGVSIPGWNTAMALYKELITGRNPTFLVGNAAVDAPLAVLTTAMREGGAHKILPIAVDLFKGYADAFKGIMSGQYTGAATSAYLKGGGGMGFYAAPSATTGAKEVQRLRRGSVLEVNSAADAARIAKDLVTLEWVKGLGERVELGPRAMAYNRALKRGLSADEAVIDGRTVTVDFAQGGTVAKILNSFVPFLNPAAQGVAQAGKTVAQHPRGALMTLGPALVGPSLAAEAWNRADPERSKAYDDVPDYVKDRGIVVMLPGAPPVDAKGEPHPQFVAINLRQYAPIAMMTREVYDRAAGRDGRTAADLLQGAAQQISPVQDASGLLPPFATTAAELAANRDLYRRTDIASERNDQRASALSQAVAPAVGARPSQVDFALRDTAGALGEMATGASNIAAGRPTGDAPQDVPVVGGFVRRLVRGDTGQQLQDARDERVSGPVARGLHAAGLTPSVSVVGTEADGIPLSRAEQADWQRRTNALVNERLPDVLADPEFQGFDQATRQKIVQRIVAGAKQAAAAAVVEPLSTDEIDARRGRKKAG